MGKKLTYKYVKEQIESVDGYKLLSDNYINDRTKLKVQCDKGHTYKVSYNEFQQKRRCPYCNGGINFTYDYIKEQIESVDGYKLLSKEYINNRTKLKVQCDKGHIYYPTYGNFYRGQRCSICNGNAKHNYKYIKKQIESVKGYKLLSKEYINAHIKLLVQCNKGHEYKVTWHKFQQGQRCPICDAQKTSSKDEKEIFNIVKQLLPDENIIENDRTQIINPLTGFNLELDIWIPKLKRAIEFNGEYWHSSNDAKYKDAEKVKQCKEKNIDLLVINERDWIDDKSKVIEQIKYTAAWSAKL